MKIFSDDQIRIYFGDASDNLFIPGDLCQSAKCALIDEKREMLAQRIGCTQLFFAHQVHGVTGVQVPSEPAFSPFAVEGDFICTSVPTYGIGVLTADCVPFVIHDPINRALSVVHAGWRGTMDNIAAHALRFMHQQYGTEPASVRVFFGPCVGVCCYAVDDPVLGAMQPGTAGRCVQTRDGNTYLDLVAYNQWVLEQAGVRTSQCNVDHHVCTICMPSYNSYRRQGRQSGRNMTVACLRA